MKKQRSGSTEDPVTVVPHDSIVLATNSLTAPSVVSSLPVDLNDISGKGKVVSRGTVAVTSGNVRPSLQQHALKADQINKTQPGQASRIAVTTPQYITGQQYYPIQQSLTSDGKVTLQFASSVHGNQPKSPMTAPVTLTSTGAPRYPSPQIITLPGRGSVAPTLGVKPSLTVVDTRHQQPVQRTVQSDGGKLTEPVKLGPGQTQISFQVPLNWNSQGSKSLLDSSKTVSLVSFTPSDSNARSLLQNSETLTSQSGVGNIAVSKVTLPGAANTAPKTYLTGNNKVFSNLAPAPVIAQTTTGLISVTKPGQSPSIARIAKGSSFMISNKQYTIVPSSSAPVVTQLVKTEKLNKGKVTMAEAQIMLPTGPAKISWPLQSQTSTADSKHILITTPVSKSNQQVAGKSPNPKTQLLVTATDSNGKSPSNSSTVPTAKVVEVGSPTKIIMTPGYHASGQKINVPMPVKTSIIPAQKNWELVKQSSQLMPQKSGKSPNTESVAEKQGEVDEIQTVEFKSTTDTNSQQSDHRTESSVKTGENVDPYVRTNEQEECNDDKTDSDARPDNKDKANGNEQKQGEDSNDSVEIKIESLQTTEEDMDVDSVSKEKVKDDTDQQEDGKDKKEDFNPVEAMTWKNGVGELPGSNLKFHMNDLGMLEVLNDGLECNETLNTSDELDQIDTTNDGTATDIKTEKEEKVDTGIKHEGSKEVSNKDEISQCDNCGEYGFSTDFYKDGRFCSQTCIRAFESKHMREVKKQGTMSKMILNMKKGKKKLLLKDGVPKDRDVKTEPQTPGKKSKAFVWTRYLEQEKAVEAPARLFKNPFPAVKNNFRVGMKLEGVDPMHQSKFCVLSVAEVSGYRVRLHFDGYSECFDFWVDIDSPFIFPVGFCEKNGKILQPPKGFTIEEFSWTSFLKLTKGVPAPKSLFSNQPVQSVTPNLFRVGSKLEAVDKKNSSLICVASVADTLGDKVLIHFDGWEDNYDYWCDMTSPFIHPVGYCEENELVLSPPRDWKDVNAFTWEKYLSKSKSLQVPARAFKPRQPIAFEPGMKVEVVDKRNPLLVRVATIEEVENYMVKIHFDGWSECYDYWLEDDSPDLHPPGWCAKTGHPLVPPITPADLVVTMGPGVCPTPGCKGIGHIKGPKYSGHHSTFGCPYSDINMNKESVLGDRLNSVALRPDETGLRYDDHRTGPDSKNNIDGEIPKKLGRGRKPKSYYIALEEQKAAREKERLEKEETLRQGIHNSVFSSSMISTPKPDVPLCWEQHCKLLPGVTSIRGNDVTKWTIDQVAAFINTLPGCEEQAKLFKEEQIDGEAFLLLTQSDIVKIMNIKLGPALKIFNSIVMFKNSIEV